MARKNSKGRGASRRGNTTRANSAGPTRTDPAPRPNNNRKPLFPSSLSVTDPAVSGRSRTMEHGHLSAVRSGPSAPRRGSRAPGSPEGGARQPVLYAYEGYVPGSGTGRDPTTYANAPAVAGRGMRKRSAAGGMKAAGNRGGTQGGGGVPAGNAGTPD